MKNLILFLLLITSPFSSVFAQDETTVSEIDAPLGLRIIKNGKDYLIFADNNLNPNFNDFRKINSRVYFRIIEYPEKQIAGKKYQLITIPGSSKKQNQNTGVESLARSTNERIGKTVNKDDYDVNFWIETEVLKETKTEHYKYANDVFSGLLTAPFKYRLKTGNAPEALIDGDFNIAPFAGWKWRVSSSRPYYVAPFGFTGLTTLSFSSANNSKITDAEQNENGVGLTYGIGISLKFGDVSPGFIIGWDKGFGNLGDGFYYNDKPWISFSINYDFFKPKQTATNQ